MRMEPFYGGSSIGVSGINVVISIEIREIGFG
jgi:hypothetical protein